MKKMIFLLAAMLGMSAAMMTSCSDDVVDNRFAGGEDALTTKAFPDAHQVKTIAVTVDGNTEYDTLTYNSAGQLIAFKIVASSGTRIGTVTRSTDSVIIVVNDTLRCAYSLDTDGYAAMGTMVNVNTSQMLDGMKFLCELGKLSKIQEYDGTDCYDLFAFEYDLETDELVSVEDASVGVPAACTMSITDKNFASIDLNWYCMLGAGNAAGDLFLFAIYADLLPNMDYLVTKLELDPDNYVNYTYTIVPVDKATACTITSAFSEEDEEGTVHQGTTTTSVVFGY